MSYLDELDAALARVKVGRTRRLRIIAEFQDHLTEDPEAKLGTPEQVAVAFADQLGSSSARRATRDSFAALVVTALSLLVLTPVVATINATTRSNAGFRVAMVLIVVGAQFALAAGGSALLKAFRLRKSEVLNRDQATILSRRAAVGLVAGAAVTIGLALIPITAPHQFAWGWELAAAIAAGLSASALLFAVPTALEAIRMRPQKRGPSTDIAADLGIPISATQTALLLSAGILVLFSLQGIVTDDPYDGVLRGLVDASLCMIGFVTLGGLLGLRPSRGVNPADTSS